ncbi:MAG UNVERIFIED_CONTAM: NACHT domain-containing protein [Planctomycetaceae bacterium]
MELPPGIRIEFEPSTEGPREILAKLVGGEEAERLVQKYAKTTPNDFEENLVRYRERSLNLWQSDFFSDEESSSPASASENEDSGQVSQGHGDRTPFIDDQRLEILVGGRNHLKFHLHPNQFRGSSEKSFPFEPANASSATQSTWVPLNQTVSSDNRSNLPVTTCGDVLVYRLTLTPDTAKHGLIDTSERLLRTVLIADSGYGKTVRLRSIQRDLCQRQASLIPFFLNVDLLPDADEELLLMLIQQLTGIKEPTHLERLKALRASGRILLLLDAADQIRQKQTLKELLTHHLWTACPMVVSARPEVVHSDADTFLSSAGFHYVRPMELTDEQVARYIGPRRYGQLENLEDARDILRNPRVAYYLGYRILESQLSQLRSASDVFESAASHLLSEGLKNHGAWRLGLATENEELIEVSVSSAGPPVKQDFQIELAHKLLSAIAFEQMLLPPESRPVEVSSSRTEIPNFSGVDGNEMPDFLDKVFQRVAMVDPRYRSDFAKERFRFDLNRLSAANVAITRGLLDVDSPFREIRWRNKSLQEFYAARWLSNHATEDDISYLTARRYHPLKKDTFWFYWVERYLCEMPRRAGEQKRWAHAVRRSSSPVTVRSLELIAVAR